MIETKNQDLEKGLILFLPEIISGMTFNNLTTIECTRIIIDRIVNSYDPEEEERVGFVGSISSMILFLSSIIEGVEKLKNGGRITIGQD